jgi:hypothetical protein
MAITFGLCNINNIYSGFSKPCYPNSIHSDRFYKGDESKNINSYPSSIINIPIFDEFCKILKGNLCSITNYGESTHELQILHTEVLEEVKEELLLEEETLISSKQYLGLNVSTISTILNISRPTVYSYMAGHIPKGKLTSDKIKKLDIILKIVRNENNLHAFTTLFKRRDMSGNTLVDYFIKDLPNIEDFVNSLCLSEIERRNKIKKKDKKIKIDNEAFSTPIFFEE